MLQIFQEAELPKLSQTSLYRQFESTSKITNVIISEIKQSKDNIVTADKIPEILSLIKLNGDVIAKKAVDAYQKNQIIVIHNPTPILVLLRSLLTNIRRAPHPLPYFNRRQKQRPK